MTSAIEPPTPVDGRRDAVLDSAMATFARFGYRKTSMDDVAAAAHISRPGLYFLFDSKPDLFRQAVTRSLDRDLDAVAAILSDSTRSLRDRLIDAFDRWAGSYVGPLDDDASGRELLGEALRTAPLRFEEMVTTALRAAHEHDAGDRARTLISASIGIKHQVDGRERYRQTVTIAIDLLAG